MNMPIPNRWANNLPLWLLLAAALGMIAFALFENYERFTFPFPYDHWEAGLNVVSWRIAHGEPLYSRMADPDGIEPGFYSPLMSELISQIFRFAHFSLFYGRLINLAAGIAFFFLFIRLFMKGRPWIEVVFATSLLMAADLQLTGLWTSPRNDIGMLFFGLVYLIAAGQAFTTQNIIWSVWAAVFFVIAFWWKQTAVFIAPVPLLVAIFTRPKASWPVIVASIGPFVVFGFSVIAARIWAPNMYQMIFVTPSKYSISPRVAVRYLLGLIDFLPLVLLSLHFCLQTKNEIWRSSKLLPWVAAVGLVSLPMGLVAAAKTGGGTNSLAFFLYAGYGLVLICLPAQFEKILTPEQPFVVRLGLAAIFSTCLIILPVNVLHTPSLVHGYRGLGDAGRPTVIDFVKNFPGKTVCPQDPTIPLEAKGFAGISLVLEWDHQLWKWPLPKVMKEISDADCVVTIGTNGSWQLWPFDQMSEVMNAKHYHRYELNSLTNSVYQIWIRDNQKEY
jgi:hypothetical protein